MKKENHQLEKIALIYLQIFRTNMKRHLQQWAGRVNISSLEAERVIGFSSSFSMLIIFRHILR